MGVEGRDEGLAHRAALGERAEAVTGVFGDGHVLRATVGSDDDDESREALIDLLGVGVGREAAILPAVAGGQTTGSRFADAGGRGLGAFATNDAIGARAGFTHGRFDVPVAAVLPPAKRVPVPERKP